MHNIARFKVKNIFSRFEKHSSLVADDQGRKNGVARFYNKNVFFQFEKHSSLVPDDRVILLLWLE
jgi:hypothetical protein